MDGVLSRHEETSSCPCVGPCSVLGLWPMRGCVPGPYSLWQHFGEPQCSYCCALRWDHHRPRHYSRWRFATWGDTAGTTLADTAILGLTHGGLGGSQAAATAGQVPIYPGSSGAAVPGGLASIVGTATAAQIAGSAASHAVPIDVSGTPTWKVIPNCIDSAGQHINYTQSTDAWSCGDI